MNTICHFCNKETANVTQESWKILKVYFCFNCLTEYVHFGENIDPAYIHLYTTINNKMYRWSTNCYDKHQNGTIAYVKEPGIPGVKLNEGVKGIKTFKSNLPTITPDNVNAKLKFILLFL